MKNLVDNLQELFSNPQKRDLIEPTITAIVKAGGVDSPDKYGKNVLFYAIESGDIELVNKILAAGADPNKKDHVFDSALMFAISSVLSGADNSIIITLLEHGADVNALNSNRETPLKLAVDLDRRLCIKPLLAHDATIPEGYARFIRNADLLIRFGDIKLIRIVIWGEPNELQEYLDNNQELSKEALNNALDAIHALRITDNREPDRAAAIQKVLEDFKDFKYPSRIVGFYRSFIKQLQQIKNFFERKFFRTPEVKFVAVEQRIDSIDVSDVSIESEAAKKDYLGRKRKHLFIHDFNKDNKENNNSENIENQPRQKSVASKRRE